MAKGQMRQTKEKKKAKAVDKQKHVSSYKASLQQGSTSATPFNPPKK
jgi:hypothetical protein